MPQWKKVMFIAERCASIERGSTTGGLAKWVMGSPTAKNMSPMPHTGGKEHGHPRAIAEIRFGIVRAEFQGAQSG